MTIRIVKMTFRREAIEEFKLLFKGNKERIRAAEGCLHLELWQDKNDPRIFMTYSHWEDSRFLETYKSSDVFGDVWPKTKALFEEKPEAWSLEVQHRLD